MSATKLQANWAPVSFNASTITQITDVSVNQGGTVDTFKADADVYDVVATVLTKRPTVSITGGDTATLMGLTGTGVIIANHNDAKLASGGAAVYTVTTCIFENCQTNGPHASFGTATATFKTYTSDGATNPIAITRV
jgi:hypothetical protein